MALRVSTAYHSPRHLIPMNWGTNATAWVGNNGGTNPFSDSSQDPNSNAFPIQYCTGRAGEDGNFTVAIEAGFTPPMNLSAWEFNRTAGKWFKLGANSGTYLITCDATYILSTFEVSENAYVLIQSDQPVTGRAWMDGKPDFQVPGNAQEG